MNLIVLGPPGSGKGTQAKLIAGRFGLIHISTGALLREFARGESAKAEQVRSLLQSGKLLPFETVLEVLGDRILEAKPGFVLDGVPRDEAQAEYVDDYFAKHNISIDLVIYLTLPDEEALKRLLLRAKQQGRSDDTEATIRERLKVYHQQTEPVVERFKQQGKLLEIDGRPTINEIYEDIVAQLEAKFPQL